MNMWMVRQALSPGVQYTQKANLRAQMLWIGGDPTQRLRCRPEQDVVNHDLILECNGLDLLGHREHHMEVVRVEQFRPTVIEPLSGQPAELQGSTKCDQY